MDFAAFQTLAPDAVAGLRALSAAVGASGLDKGLLELVKVRASQLNGCAFCLAFHLKLARDLGVEQRKLDLLPVWREAGCFDERERAALAWTEALTLAPATIPPEVRTEVEAAFSPSEVAFLSAGVAVINAWNRIAGPLGFPAP